jgi:hypothetical protein
MAPDAGVVPYLDDVFVDRVGHSYRVLSGSAKLPGAVSLD